MDIDISKGLFFSDGNLVSGDIAVMAAGFNDDPEAEFSRVVFLFRREWHHFDVETDVVVSVTSSDRQCYLVGSGGLAIYIPFQGAKDMDALSEGTRMWVIEDVQEFGELTRVRMVNDVPYSCGQCGQVYRLSGNAWSRADKEFRSDDAPDLEDIDGNSASDIYAVGIGGALCHFNGRRWSQLDSPTNLNLSNVRCLSSKVTYICGDDGVVLRGNKDTWEIITDLDKGRHYWGMEYFNEVLYLAHGGGIDRLTDHGVVPVEIPLDIEPGFHRLHSSTKELWSFGNDDILAFDGDRWRKVNIPVRT